MYHRKLSVSIRWVNNLVKVARWVDEDPRDVKRVKFLIGFIHSLLSKLSADLETKLNNYEKRNNLN